MLNRLVLGLLALCVMVAGARADWNATTDAMIEKHRKSDVTLTLRTPDGKPLANTEVDLRQTRAAFLFGTAINEWHLERDTPDSRKYQQFIVDHFNGLVSEDSMKWYSIEKERGIYSFRRGDLTVAFAQKHDMPLRGHALFWCKTKYVHRANWVEQLTTPELAEAIDLYIRTTVSRYAGKVFCWDVNNEMLDGQYFKERLGDEIRPHMFKEARKWDPQALLFVNEYDILGNDQKLERFITLIKDLQAAGAPVTGIGIQEHAAERIAPENPATQPDVPDDAAERQNRFPLHPADIHRRLDRLAELKLPIHITEVSFKTKDDDRRARALDQFFRTIYAHPKVDALLLWGFWSRSHFLGRDAALVDNTWTVLPAGKAYQDLVLNKWRTNAALRTDAEGRVTLRGFHGRYAITARDGSLQGVYDHAPEKAQGTVPLTPAVKAPATQREESVR